MAIRKVTSPIIFLFFIIKTTSGAIQVDVSQMTINFGNNQINTYLPSCFGVDLEFFLQVSTSNYSTQSTYFIQQQDAKSMSVSLTNTSTFQIQSPTDFISITGLLSMRCSVAPAPFSDSFLLQTQSATMPDKNNVDVQISVISNTNQWTLMTTINRKCTGVGQYGFNCNEQCSDVNDAYHCYTCGTNGQKQCCASADVNQNDCTYYDHPATSTWSPSVHCSQSAENTYFWLMISFAIIIVVFAIILLLLLLELCCGIFTRRAAKGSEDGDWIVQNEPRANRELYDGDINRQQHYRRRNDETRNKNELEESRRSPFFVNREGLDNQTYDDESLRDQWVEPQPRRVARV